MPPNSKSRRNRLLGRANKFAHGKRYDDALVEYKKALAFDPELAEAWLGCGNVYAELGLLGEAISAFAKALALKSDLTEALLGCANVLAKMRANNAAIEAYDHLLKIKCDFPEAWLGLANVFYSLARYEDAIAAYTKAKAGQHIPPYTQGALLDSKMHICDWSDFHTDRLRLIASVNDGNLVADPFAFFNVSSLAADQLKCAELYSRNRFPPAAKPLWRGERYSHDRIRIAYVSADLRDHATSFLLAGVFERHDKTMFETTAISLCRDNASKMRKRLLRAFDRFIDVENQSDSEVANLMHGLEIDIAVDLMGHTAASRFGIFARRPAPIQVEFLGYPGTSGAQYIDYIVADRFVLPEKKHCTEQIVYLPDTFQPNDTRRLIGSRVPSRSQAGLPEVGFVFCAMNNVRKITPIFFYCWMRLLRCVEGSVLWMSAPNATAESNLRREAEKRGVDPHRLIFASRLPYPDHLARLALGGLFLDTFPFNGGTTASDALWAGLPLITCAGEGFASRMAGSLLLAAGLPELIVHSVEEYEGLALELARNPLLLAITRDKLARNRNTCALFNTDRFTRHIEAAYKMMCERSRLGQPATCLSIEQLA